VIDLDDTSRCPLGVRCEACGAEAERLAVCTAELGRLGVACLTMCPRCAAGGTGAVVAASVSVSTAVRLVLQHCAHLGVDADDMAELLA
jgi:hypothetical protein